MSGQAILIIFALFSLRSTLCVQTVAIEGSTIVEPIDTSGFTQIGRKLYFIENDKKLNWFAAAHYCRAKGADLATIGDQNEMSALSAHLLSKGYGNDDMFWLSGNDLEAEGRFKWLSNGLPMSYTKWSAGQPDNWQEKEHCVEVWRIEGQFLMNDRDCAKVSRFVCEAPVASKATYSVW